MDELGITISSWVVWFEGDPEDDVQEKEFATERAARLFAKKVGTDAVFPVTDSVRVVTA